MTHITLWLLKLRDMIFKAMPGILLGLHKCFNISEFKHSKTFYLCSRNFQGKPLAYELTDEYLKWGCMESSCKNSRITAFTF
jgi:hypothetical protein